uniref:Uncharacterized protein n=1 Tax=Oryza rufipogon TaxID=4529 RepID=A0A0E0PIX9_ORYRU
MAVLVVRNHRRWLYVAGVVEEEQQRGERGCLLDEAHWRHWRLLVMNYQNLHIPYSRQG